MADMIGHGPDHQRTKRQTDKTGDEHIYSGDCRPFSGWNETLDARQQRRLEYGARSQCGQQENHQADKRRTAQRTEVTPGRQQQSGPGNTQWSEIGRRMEPIRQPTGE